MGREVEGSQLKPQCCGSRTPSEYSLGTLEQSTDPPNAEGPATSWLIIDPPAYDHERLPIRHANYSIVVLDSQGLCLSVNKITQKVLNGFKLNFQEMLMMGHGRVEYILVVFWILE